MENPPEEKLVEPTADQPTPSTGTVLNQYWKSNIRIMSILMGVWAFVSLGCGILFADVLNMVRLPGLGYPLGFWFAQQGSIIVFVIIILVYCIYMNRLDEKHHQDLEIVKNDDEVQP